MAVALAVAACTPRLEVALAVEGGAPGIVALPGLVPRSELIMAAVDLLVRGAGAASADIDALAVTRGPGSFTGVRVGLATALGISRALSCPVVAVSSLQAQAARTDHGRIVALQPARRGMAYAQVFVRDGDELAPEGPIATRDVDGLADLDGPFVAPEGFALPPELPRARAERTITQALLTILASSPEDRPPLSPLYVEPPAARPPSRTAPPWPPSPKDS